MKYRILVVEDNPIILNMIEDTFKIFGYNYEIAKNGEEAFNKLEQMSQNESGLPHLVLSDIKMPVMGGIELLERCRKKYPNLPFIIMSGDLSGYTKKLDELGIHYLAKGVNGFIAKLKQEIEQICLSQS